MSDSDPQSRSAGRSSQPGLRGLWAKQWQRRVWRWPVVTPPTVPPTEPPIFTRPDPDREPDDS